MRDKYFLYLFLTITLVLSGCITRDSSQITASNLPEKSTLHPRPEFTTTAMLTLKPTDTGTHLPSPTIIIPTVTSTQTPTMTPYPTLEPEQAEEVIRTLLRDPVDCEAPCFWGIVPGKTTLGEAHNNLTHLGLQLDGPRTVEAKEFYEINYDFDSGLSISPLLAVLNGIIENITIYITPEKSQSGVPREWLAYSPETLISRYGSPSKAVFGVGGAAPTPGYTMVLYFDTVDLIIEYDGYEYTSDGYVFEICPLTNQWEGVRIWMGENPYNPPPSFLVPLRDATTLTMEEFSSIMTGDPENACIELVKEAVQNP